MIGTAAPTAYHCCVALPVIDTKQGSLQKLASKAQRRITNFSKNNLGKCIPVKKGMHVSLVEFTTPSLALATKINSLVVAEVQKFKPFTITAYKDRASLFTGLKKDFVVLGVKTMSKKTNKTPKMLMHISSQINSIIVGNGGTLSFPQYKPHITVGKVVPQGVSKTVKLPKTEKLRLSVNPKNAFSFKPFPA